MKTEWAQFKVGVVPDSLCEVEDMLISKDDGDVIATFHPKKVYMVKRNDEYVFDIKASHFVVIEGYSEFDFNRKCYVVLANHKGWLRVKTFLGEKCRKV